MCLLLADHVIDAMTASHPVTNHHPMAISHGRPTGRPIDPGDVITTALVDDVIARYVEWREDTEIAACAYRRWAEAPRGERPSLFTTFTAALDQEEAAAAAYERSIARLGQRCDDSSPRRT